jgi:HlyD family secretion protein
MARRRSRVVLSAAGAVVFLAALAALSQALSAFDLFNKGERAFLVVSGNIEAHESVLSFKAVQSRITVLPFDEGQWVEKGTVLAILDDADYRQQVVIAAQTQRVQERQLAAALRNLEAAKKTVAADKADLAEKTVDFHRDQELWRHQVISTQTRDLAATAYKQSSANYLRDKALEAAAEANVTVARANVKNAQDNLKLAQIILGYTTLYAPFSGVILVRNAELGEVVQPGTPIFTLADLDHIWLRAYINEPDIGRVRFGQPAVVTTDSYPNHQYHGRISLISSNAEFTPKSVETHAERVTLVYRIRIDIDNPTHELKPGMPADARISFKPAGAR